MWGKKELHLIKVQSANFQAIHANLKQNLKPCILVKGFNDEDYWQHHHKLTCEPLCIVCPTLILGLFHLFPACVSASCFHHSEKRCRPDNWCIIHWGFHCLKNKAKEKTNIVPLRDEASPAWLRVLRVPARGRVLEWCRQQPRGRVQRGLFSQQPLSLADKTHITSTKVTAAPNELKCLDVSASTNIVSIEYISPVCKIATTEMLFVFNTARLIGAIPSTMEKVIEVYLPFLYS